MVERGLMLATTLAPVIGYDAAAGIAKEAAKSGRTIREVAREQDAAVGGRAVAIAGRGEDDGAGGQSIVSGEQ